MGGRIWVESAPGTGQHVPLHRRFGSRTSTLAPEPPVDVPPRGLRALVVDDNATSRRILDEMLARWACQCSPSRPRRLGRARAALARGPLHLSFTDNQMPELDGPGLAVRSRAIPRFAALTIVMLSSAGSPGDAMPRAAALAAHLVKPITQSELLEALVAALGGRRRLARRRAPAAARVARFGCFRRGQRGQPARGGARARAARAPARVVNDGRHALDALDDGAFDLVLMDVQMPEMDGLEATRPSVRASRQAGGAGPRPAGIGSFDPARARGDPMVALTAHATTATASAAWPRAWTTTCRSRSSRRPCWPRSATR